MIDLFVIFSDLFDELFDVVPIGFDVVERLVDFVFDLIVELELFIQQDS